MSNRKRLVVVLGMHRSGTSLITRGLQALGVNLGGRLIGPIAGVNDTGFWEDLDINALNIDLLQHLGQDWDTIKPIHDLDFNDEIIQKFVLRGVVLINNKIQNAESFGIKDPRIPKLLQFWQKVFEQLPVDVVYVICVRNPLSIIKSLEKRDGFSAEKSAYLWLTHIASSLIHTQDKERVFVDYDLLIANPEKELARIAHVLGTAFSINSPKVREYCDGFISKNLQHTKFDIQKISLFSGIPQESVELFDLLEKLSMDEIGSRSEQVIEYSKKLAKNVSYIEPILNLVSRNELEIKSLKNKINQEKGILAVEKQHAQVLYEEIQRQLYVASNTHKKREQELLEIQNREIAKNKELESRLDVLQCTLNDLRGKSVAQRHTIIQLENTMRDKEAVLINQSNEIIWMRESVFWKLRRLYMRARWAVRCPLKFIKKYLWRRVPTYPQISWAVLHPKKFVHKYLFKRKKISPMFSHEELSFFNTCLELVSYLPKDIPRVSKRSHNKSILVETRNVPHLEFLIKNTIQKLGNGWGHMVFCGQRNIDQVTQICAKISPDIEIILLDEDIKTKNDFNNLFLSLDFWNKVQAEKVLVYQTDTFFAKNLPKEMLQYDWIGAPIIAKYWDHKEAVAVAARIREDGWGVGNGGFSLRNVSKIKQVLEQGVLIKNDGSYPSKYLPEDIYFVEMFLRCGFHVAHYSQARKFSFEHTFTDAVGCHQPWLALGGFTRDFIRSRITQQKKVIFINHEETLTGAPRVLKDMISMLYHSNLYEVFSLSINPGDAPWHNILHHRIAHAVGDTYREKVEFIAKVLQPDLVFANTIESVPTVVLFKNVQRIAYIHERDHLHSRLDSVKLLGQFDDVWAVCDDTIKILELNNIFAKNIEYPLSLSGDDFLDIWGEDYILGIGSVSSRKGVDRFLQLAARLPQQQFIWVGPLVWSKIVGDIVTLDSGAFCEIPSNVKFVGAVPPRQVTRNWIAKAKVVLLLSYDDPFPIVVVESKIMNKKIVVIKDAGDAYKLCDEGDLVLDHYHESDVLDYIKSITPSLHQMNHVLMKRFRNNIKVIARNIDEVLNIQRIPKIIHQIGRGDHDSCEELSQCSSLKKLHPGYEYKFWTEDGLLKFIEREYPEILFFYTQLPYAIQRSHLARLLVLSHFGGIYIDHNMNIQKPLDQLLASRCFLVYDKAGVDFKDVPMISNALIGSEPRSKYISCCIDSIIEYVRTGNITENQYIVESTGALLISKVMCKFTLDASVMVYPWEYFQHNSDEVTIWGSESQVVDSVEYPMVSCVMVSKNNPKIVQHAVDAFYRQTYPNKELVITYQEGNPHSSWLKSLESRMVRVFVQPDSASLGVRRNFATTVAQGEFIIVWDDDDYYHKDRITKMMAMLYDSKDAVLLCRLVKMFLDEEVVGLTEKRPWEGSILFRKSIFDCVGYSDKSRGEDTDFTDNIQDRKIVDMAYLYLYNYHGDSVNVWGREHHKRLLERKLSGQEVILTAYQQGNYEFLDQQLEGVVQDNDLKISVIMGVYLGDYPGAATDREGKFCRAVDSFLGQDYQKKELVIIGDACPIAEKNYREQYSQYKNIVFFNLEKKQPLYSGELRNKGLELATGDLICYLDSDDFIGTKHLTSIAKQYEPKNDWFYWNDHVVDSFKNLKHFSSTERHSEFKEGALGTSCFGHVKKLPIHWETGYGHDWWLVKSLANHPHQKLVDTAYYVGHIYDALGSKKVLRDT